MVYTSIWRRLMVAVPCVLLVSIILPLTTLAKSYSGEPPHGPIVSKMKLPRIAGPFSPITTDAPCSNPTILLPSLLSQWQVSGVAEVSSSDSGEESEGEFLSIQDTAGSFSKTIDYLSTQSFSFTVPSDNDTLTACILAGTDGPDGDEQGTMVLNLTSTASNWAGYILYGTPTDPVSVSDVKGSWRVPLDKCSKNETSDAALWVGLGGVSQGILEQIGINSNCANGHPQYDAWWEMVPGPPMKINDTVRPGDSMQAEVNSIGTGTFVLTLNDSTQNWKFSTTQTRQSTLTDSAECVLEARNGRQLMKFGTAVVSGCLADNVPINSGPLTERVVLIGQFLGISYIRAIPSNLRSGGTTFTVTWQHS